MCIIAALLGADPSSGAGSLPDSKSRKRVRSRVLGGNEVPSKRVSEEGRVEVDTPPNIGVIEWNSV